MATAPSVKQEQSARSQRVLIEAATSLFAERGYRDTSVQAIAERAGVSRGSIFWHFESKEGLLWAVAARAFESWEREVLVPDVGEATGIEAISRALSAHRRFLTERMEGLRLFYVLMFEALGPRAELAPEFAKLHANLRAMTVDWIRRAIEAGEIRDDVDAAAVVTMITGALGGIAYQWLLDPGGFDLDRVYADLEKTLSRGLR
jgi:TetR/AcrR family transcriptional regulator, acrAB operon repressor